MIVIHVEDVYSGFQAKKYGERNTETKIKKKKNKNLFELPYGRK